MAEIVDPILEVGTVVSVAPADGIVGAIAGDGTVKILEAWDPVQGDVFHSAPGGSTGGGGTRRHLFDRELYVDTGGAVYVNIRAFASITGKPTTVQGYGITNAVRTDLGALQTVNADLSITGTLTASVNVRSTGAGGLALGSLTGVARITHGVAAANSFAFLTSGNANADLRVGNLVADVDNAYDLGDGSHRWRNLYVAGTLTFGTLALTGAFTVTAATATSTLAYIGTGAPPSGLTSGRSAGINVAIDAETASPRLFVVTAKNGAAAAAPRIIMATSNGTFSAPTATANGDTLGIVEFTGYDGTTQGADGSIIQAVATEAWGAGHGTQLEFYTTANGSSAALALTLGQDKKASFGSGTVSITPTGTNPKLTLVGSNTWDLQTVAAGTPFQITRGGTLVFQLGSSTGLLDNQDTFQMTLTTSLNVFIGANENLRVSTGAAGEAGVMVRDVTAAALKRVSFGANDSGGVGFKLLRVAN